MSTERKMSPSTRFHLLHVTLIVSLHILVVGIAIKWWGIHWLPKYFAFHQNRGYLNSDLFSSRGCDCCLLFSSFQKVAVVNRLLECNHYRIAAVIHHRLWSEDVRWLLGVTRENRSAKATRNWTASQRFSKLARDLDPRVLGKRWITTNDGGSGVGVNDPYGWIRMAQGRW